MYTSVIIGNQDLMWVNIGKHARVHSGKHS